MFVHSHPIGRCINTKGSLANTVIRGQQPVLSRDKEVTIVPVVRPSVAFRLQRVRFARLSPNKSHAGRNESEDAVL